jgi:hypothetical protein
MSAETTTTTLTEVVRQCAYAESALYFAAKPGLSNFVTTQDITGQPTLVARFPLYNSIDATAISENTDFTTNSALDTSNSVDVTVSEHIVKFTITDLASGATVDTIGPQAGIAGRAAAEALQRRQDGDISALFASFDSSTGDNDGKLTTTLVYQAINLLDVASIPESGRSVILHPYQWGTVAPSYGSVSSFGTAGQQIVNTGAVGQLYGCLVFQTANVATATVSSSTCYAGAVMHASAIALATKGEMPKFEVERDASLRAYELVGTAVWGEAEYRGGATTSGIGGAGVFLYSNTTVNA